MFLKSNLFVLRKIINIVFIRNKEFLNIKFSILFTGTETWKLSQEIVILIITPTNKQVLLGVMVRVLTSCLQLLWILFNSLMQDMM